MIIIPSVFLSFIKASKATLYLLALASPIISTGFFMLAVAGKFSFKILIVFFLNEATSRLFFLSRSIVIAPGPPALVKTAISGPFRKGDIR